MTEYQKEKIACTVKIPRKMLCDVKYTVAQNGDDEILELLTARLTGFIASRVAEERDFTHYFQPPTFFDWLFRRKRKFSLHITVKDVLKNPPQQPYGTIRMYEFEPNQ